MRVSRWTVGESAAGGRGVELVTVTRAYNCKLTDFNSTVI